MMPRVICRSRHPISELSRKGLFNIRSPLWNDTVLDTVGNPWGISW